MAEDSEKKETKEDEDGDAQEERPTVSPPFDPIAFARDVLGGIPSPAKGTPKADAPADSQSDPHTKATPPRGMRPPMPTLSDPGETEDARLRSMGSGTHPQPKGALSLANARIPSNLPKAGSDSGPPKHESLTGMNAVDREWAELEVATRPPPAGENPEEVEIAKAPAPMGPSINEVDDPAQRVSSAPPSAEAAPKRPPSDPEIEIVKEESPATEEEMHDRVALGDYSGALEIAERLLEEEPDNPAVNACAENCRSVLKQMYSARLGPLDKVPIVAVPRDQLRWLSIDHKAGFVLSLVDGVSSLEMILDVSGMPELDALRILSELAQQRIIGFR